MDGLRFDLLTRSLATSRRSLLRGLAGAVGGGVLAAVGLDDAAAQSCRVAGRTCRENANCCSGLCEAGATGHRRCHCRTPDDCPPPHPCHAATCDAGVCGTTITVGAGCDDGNACTTNHTCTATGHCVGTPTICTARDQCHDVGVCDRWTGRCSDPAKADGSACSTGSPCSINDTCQAGVCTSGGTKDCSAQDDQCNTGVCSQFNGQCARQPKTAGTNCNADHSLCTVGDACDADGNCLPGAAVVCPALDQCHDAGTCDPTTGVCSNPTQPNGVGCTLAGGGAGHCCGGVCQPCCTSADCAGGQECVNGLCVCDAISCPSGCCSGTICAAGTSDGACGTGGAACQDCTALLLICECANPGCTAESACCQGDVGPDASCSATVPCCRGSSCRTSGPDAGTCCRQIESDCYIDAASECCSGVCIPYEPICGGHCPGTCQ